MFCPNCGTANVDTSQFCAKCGQTIRQQMPGTMSSMDDTIAMPIPRASVPAQKFNFMAFIIAIFLKPVTTLKDKLKVFEDFKLSAIFAAIVAAASMIISLFTNMYYAIVTKTGYGDDAKTELVWSNLKELKWVDLIIKNYFIILAVIAAIALVYFLAGLIIKKDVKYQRLLGLIATAAIPLILAFQVLAPITGWIYFEAGVVVTLVGLIFAICLVLNGVNRELSLEDNDAKLYINLACISIIVLAVYFIFPEVVLGIGAAGAVNNIADEMEDFLKDLW